MKTTLLSAITFLFVLASRSDKCLGQARPVGKARMDVLEMKAVPDGHFLANLQWNGQDRVLNIEVKDGVAKCVNSDEPRLKGLEGRFQPIGNGVFLIFFQNDNHRASRFWVFHKDGSAVVKEVPDRGEKQTAIPVENDSLKAPEKN